MRTRIMPPSLAPCPPPLTWACHATLPALAPPKLLAPTPHPHAHPHALSTSHPRRPAVRRAGGRRQRDHRLGPGPPVCRQPGLGWQARRGRHPRGHPRWRRDHLPAGRLCGALCGGQRRRCSLVLQVHHLILHCQVHCRPRPLKPPPPHPPAPVGSPGMPIRMQRGQRVSAAQCARAQRRRAQLAGRSLCARFLCAADTAWPGRACAAAEPNDSSALMRLLCCRGNAPTPTPLLPHF